MRRLLVEERAYAIRSLSEFISGSGNERDWDDFTSLSLKDPNLDSIRRRALAIQLPVGNEGEAALLKLPQEAEAVQIE